METPEDVKAILLRWDKYELERHGTKLIQIMQQERGEEPEILKDGKKVPAALYEFVAYTMELEVPLTNQQIKDVIRYMEYKTGVVWNEPNMVQGKHRDNNYYTPETHGYEKNQYGE